MGLTEERWSAAMRAERTGDAASYEWLLRDISRALRPAIRHGVQQASLAPAEVEDILQDVLIGLHTMRRRWDDTRPFLPWLHAILRYKLTDTVRRRGRERRIRVDLSAEAWDAIVDEAALQDGAMTDDALMHALDALPAGQRQVVEAVAIDGASVRDTAAALHISEGAIRMTMHRAFKKLASLAEGAGGKNEGDRK
jgi:RNA polymerase sigma-70 factor (ECF subfamily)